MALDGAYLYSETFGIIGIKWEYLAVKPTTHYVYENSQCEIQISNIEWEWQMKFAWYKGTIFQKWWRK